MICTASSPSPASLASMVNSTGSEAGTPVVLRPGPLARTLLASWVGSTFTLYGLGEERLHQHQHQQPWDRPPHLCGSYLRGISSSSYSTLME